MITVPSGDQAVEKAQPSSSVSTRIRSQVGAVQISIVFIAPPPAPLANCILSGDQASEAMTRAWVAIVVSSSPLSAAHTLRLRPSAPLAILEPSGPHPAPWH